MLEKKKTSALTALRNYIRFNRSPNTWRQLVFYSEGPEYWLHFRTLVEEILNRDKVDVSYVSSSPNDPGLKVDSPRFHPFEIGFGLARTLWFMTLNAKIAVLTMPDLETFHIKRSRLKNTRYIYIFHAPVSTHMMYRDGAFDHFDEIFCVGPHHEAEIRKREQQLSLPEKTLFRHGYARLDDLIEKAGVVDGCASNDPIWVMVASSWTDNGIIATVSTRLVSILLNAGFKVTVRTHPRTSLIHPERIESLQAEFGQNERFSLEDGSSESVALVGSDIMICDWSGVAIEYGFVRGMPVLFIDTPRKINNRNYENLGLEPMEAAVRSDIGEVVPLDAIGNVPEIIHRLCSNSVSEWKNRINVRNKWIYNIGSSHKIGADRLIKLAEGCG